MTLSAHIIMLILAIVFFGLATLKVKEEHPPISWLALGCVFLSLSFLVR